MISHVYTVQPTSVTFGAESACTSSRTLLCPASARQWYPRECPCCRSDIYDRNDVVAGDESSASDLAMIGWLCLFHASAERHSSFVDAAEQMI